MTIHRMLQNVPLGPERIADLVEAYQITLKKLRLVERNDWVTQTIAKKIIEVGQTGVIMPDQISELAIKELDLK